jgi:hypothetical protein
MKGMQLYYISRAILSVAFGGLFVLAGSPWWMGMVIGGLAFAFFLWAPHSGRYAVHPELGVTALRRDEHTQTINDKAGRNAFVAVAFALAGLSVYYGLFVQANVPVALLNYTLILGIAVYYISELILRRA